MPLFKIIYWAGIVAQIIIRAPFGASIRSLKKTDRRVSQSEKIILGLLTLTGLLLPLIYTFTPWLNFANYQLPVWLGWLGVFLMICSLFVFARAHIDLKSNWSPSLEIYQGHTLVTNGIYQYVRHPMYASQALLVCAQVLLLQNWLAGPPNLIVLILFYLFRIQAEEKMMLDAFGESYREYMRTTGRILPKF
jgi:protein-S-isoprenylcysteine O-methyltransferase Ste14